MQRTNEGCACRKFLSLLVLLPAFLIVTPDAAAQSLATPAASFKMRSAPQLTERRDDQSTLPQYLSCLQWNSDTVTMR